MLELNKIYNMDCISGMKLIEDNSIDLVVTSPPYDGLREYNGYSFDFENTE
jgi:DNA modification methylase